MLRYVTQRLLQGIIVLFIVSLVTFGSMHLAPGDPIDVLIGFESQVSTEQAELIREKWGLDRPWYEQYLTWLTNFVQADFGQSVFQPGVPVRDMITDAAGPTLKLNSLAIILSLLVALPAGVLAGVKRYSIFDSAMMVGANAGVAFPSFWVALMLIVIFSGKLNWLPSTGLDSWKQYLMPVFVLAFNEVAILARLVRGSTLETLGQDYVTTARAKGLSGYAVITQHVLRNALLPIITVTGLRVAFLLSGSVIVETIFGIGGMGRLFYQSIIQLDYQVVQALVVIFTLLVIVVNIITDLAYAIVDPRIRTR